MANVQVNLEFDSGYKVNLAESTYFPRNCDYLLI